MASSKISNIKARTPSLLSTTSTNPPTDNQSNSSTPKNNFNTTNQSSSSSSSTSTSSPSSISTSVPSSTSTKNQIAQLQQQQHQRNRSTHNQSPTKIPQISSTGRPSIMGARRQSLLSNSSTPASNRSISDNQAFPSKGSNENEEVTMLREQLAKLQSELRIARGHIATQELQISRSATPSNKSLFGLSTPTAGPINRSRSHQNLSPSSSPVSSVSSSPNRNQQSPQHKNGSEKNSKHSRRSKNKRSQNHKQSSLHTENSEGLSIRFISGAGTTAPTSAMQTESYLVSETINSTAPSLPGTDSGYVKDINGDWVSIQSVPKRQFSASPNSTPPPFSAAHQNQTRSPQLQSSSDLSKGLSRIPVSAVSLGRVLAGDMSASTSSRKNPNPKLEEVEDQGFEGNGSEQEGELGSADHADEEKEGGQQKDSKNSEPRPRRRFNYSRSAQDCQDLVLSPTSPNFEENMSPTNSSSDRPPSAAGSASMATRQSRTNPFFSSGVGRDRGAMIHQQHDRSNLAQGNNTSRVITTLQTDLLYSRTALDQSKSQLRLSQRTVESMSRQNEDLKESMARLRLENEGLSKMLSRKERTVSELMERIKKSESEASTLKQERKEIDSSLKKITKESDETVKDALKKKERAESQYEAIKSGVKSLNEAWKRDVNGLKEDFTKLQEKHRKELEDSKLKYQTLAKLHASRSGSLSTLESNINSLKDSKAEFVRKYSSEIESIKDRLDKEEKLNQSCLELAKDVAGECSRFKKILRNHSLASSSSSNNSNNSNGNNELINNLIANKTMTTNNNNNNGSNGNNINFIRRKTVKIDK